MELGAARLPDQGTERFVQFDEFQSTVIIPGQHRLWKDSHDIHSSPHSKDIYTKDTIRERRRFISPATYLHRDQLLHPWKFRLVHEIVESVGFGVRNEPI